MKLRFRQNSLRLRLNRKEVEELAGGFVLREEIRFPGGSRLEYLLEPFGQGAAMASFAGEIIRIAAPGPDIKDWAGSDAIGMYFHLLADGVVLDLAIEKDLECLEGPADERDPHAFARQEKAAC